MAINMRRSSQSSRSQSSSHRLRRLRALAGHVLAPDRSAAAAATPATVEESPSPAAEAGWQPTAAHGFIPYSVTAADHSQLAEQGYLLLPPVLEPAALKGLLEDVQGHWDVVKDGHAAGEGTWLQAGLLPNIHHLSERARDVYWRGPVVGVARELIGPNIKAATSQLTFKMPGMHQGVDFHQDNGYGHLQPHTSLSCLLALDDVDLDNGPVRLVPGSHIVGQRALDDGDEYVSAASGPASGPADENFKEQNGSRVIKTDMGREEGVPMTMKAGQVLIMHCHIMHTSQPNLSDRPRRIMFTRYADADAVEAYNPGAPPRMGRLLCGVTRYPEVARFEATGESWSESTQAAASQLAQREAARSRG